MLNGSVVIISNRCDDVARRLQPNADAASATTAEQVAEVARQRVRVLTGELKGSIDVQKDTDGSYVVSAGTDHARFNEFGTVHMSAQPFMIPGVESARPQHPANVARRLLDFF